MNKFCNIIKKKYFMTILFGKIIQFKLILKIIRCHFYPISTQCALLLKMETPKI